MAKPLGILLGDRDRHAKLRCSLEKDGGLGQHTLSLRHGGQEAVLNVDEEEGGFGCVKEHQLTSSG